MNRSQNIIHASISIALGLGLVFYGIIALGNQVKLKQFLTFLQTIPDQKLGEMKIKEMKKYPHPGGIVPRLYFEFRFNLDYYQIDRAFRIGHFLQSSFPGFYDLEYQLALLYLMDGKPAKGLEWIEKSIDAHPLEEKNYYLKASLQKKMGHEEKAENSRLEGIAIGKRNLSFRSKGL